MTTENTKMPALPTGQEYNSVADLLNGEGVSADVKARIKRLANETKIVLQLAKVRQKVGLTQQQMADHLGVSQSAVSKLETGPDDNVTVREIKEYARATGERIALSVGKPLSHVEAVRMHALGIKNHLDALASIANQGEELENAINRFFGEAFFNILNILAVYSEKLPSGGPDFEIKMEILRHDLPSRFPTGRGETSTVAHRFLKMPLSPASTE